MATWSELKTVLIHGLFHILVHSSVQNHTIPKHSRMYMCVFKVTSLKRDPQYAFAARAGLLFLN